MAAFLNDSVMKLRWLQRQPYWIPIQRLYKRISKLMVIHRNSSSIWKQSISLLKPNESGFIIFICVYHADYWYYVTLTRPLEEHPERVCDRLPTILIMYNMCAKIPEMSKALQKWWPGQAIISSSMSLPLVCDPESWKYHATYTPSIWVRLTVP